MFVLLDARAELVASDAKYAENTIQTSNQRLFLSSDGGFYELTRDSAGWHKNMLPAIFRDGVARPCYYLGIAETAGTVYTVCTENFSNPFAKKYLMGLNIYQPAPQLIEAGQLTGMSSINGLDADGSGNLYAADPGLPLLSGKIIKITMAGSHTIATQNVFHRFIASKPNGIRYAGGKMYISTNPTTYIGTSELMRYDLGANGLYNARTIFKSLWFLDDFMLVQGGAVVTEFLGGRLTHINESGSVLHRASFSQPTSITLLSASTYGSGSVLVTRRDAGEVHRLASNWGLLKR